MTKWYNKTVEEVAKELDVDLQNGLNQKQVNEKLKRKNLYL